MRNIDKTIDDILPPISEEELKNVVKLITVRKTEEERSDLIVRCCRKFNLEKSVLEEKVKSQLYGTAIRDH